MNNQLKMSVFKKTTAVMLAMAIIYLYLCSYLGQVSEKEHYISELVLRPRKHMYLVESPSCKISDLEPYEMSVAKYFLLKKPKLCTEKQDFTHQKGNMLLLNQTGVKKFCGGKFSHCEYSTVIRKGDNSFKYSQTIKFTGNTVVSSEFIRVKCICNDKNKVYTNFHAFVHAAKRKKTSKGTAKTTTPRPPDNATGISNKTQLNVILFGIDSISRLNSYRQLSDTRDFILNTLGGIELKGYNKVADNTFVNIMPMIFGKYIKEMPWDTSVRKPFDEYDFMWSKYRRQGYKTLYAEDDPSIVMFNGNKVGFKKPPTDHYFRPMSVAMENEGSIWWSDHHCINSRLEVQVIMQYLYDFISTHQSEPRFSFTFLSRLAHNEVNMIGTADYAFKDFFQRLHDNQMLNDTLLFFFSDHGIRFGKFRETLQGKMEERLPMMYIVTPKWFPGRFPKLWNNLKNNKHRLTTPFDVYETLLAALNLEEFEANLPNIDLNRRGVNLFAAVPQNRSCESATILPHWCTCQRGQKLPVNDSTAVEVAGLIVAHINKLLHSDKGKCATLKLDKVLRVSVIMPNEKMLKYVGCVSQDVDTAGVNYGKATQLYTRVYQLALRTKPGLALFETTVEYEAKGKKIGMLGDISRTNKYGSQSKCTSKPQLKKYCYCK